MRDYASHLEPLRIVSTLVGEMITSVVELGSGKYSTPFWLSRNTWPNIDNITSFEDNEEWNMCVKGLVDDVRLTFTEQLPEVKKADLIFIDNGQNRKERVQGIHHVGKQRPSGLVVLHDADDQMYREIAIPYFDHMVIYKEAFPHTAVCWNAKKWTELLKELDTRWM